MWSGRAGAGTESTPMGANRHARRAGAKPTWTVYSGRAVQVPGDGPDFIRGGAAMRKRAGKGMALVLGALAVGGPVRVAWAQGEAPVFYPLADSALRGLPFSEAVRVGSLLILSGQIGNAPGSRGLAPGGIAAEARQALENIKGVLQRHGASLKDVVKCTAFLADIGEWAAFNEVYKEYFKAPYPARSALGTTGLALGARVELECMAVVP